MSDALGRPGSVVVFGGSSEIGLAIARALAERGAPAVVLAARRPDSLEAATAPLRAAGAAVDTVAFDALAIDQHDAMVGAAFERAHALGGDVDVAVIAFGVLAQRTPLAADPAEAARMAITNYAGAVSTGLATVRRLHAQGRGTLVVLSSMAGQRPRAESVVYASTKAGLDSFGEGLDEALRGSGVRVVTVRPGWVHTRMTAGLGRLPLAISADHVAADVLRGLDGGARVVWSPRYMRWVAMAMHLAPAPLFRVASRGAAGSAGRR